MLYEIKKWLDTDWKKTILVWIMFACGTVYGILTEYRCIESLFLGNVIGTSRETLNIPYTYLICNFYMIWVILSFPFKHMDSMESNVILRMKSRYKWWLNKCVWCVFFLVTAYVPGFIAFFAGDKIKRKFTLKHDIIFPLTFMLVTLFILILCMRVIADFGAMAATVVSCLLLIAAIFSDAAVFVGKYLMIYRYIDPDGKILMTPEPVMIVMLILDIALIFVPLIRYKSL